MRTLRAVALSLWILPPIALVGCDEPVVPSVTSEAITVNSATSYAVVVAFDRPVSRASATQSSRYALTRPAGDRLLPSRAALVDSLFGQAVQLVFPLGTLEDSTVYRLTVAGVQDAWGRPLSAGDSVTVEFKTGLWYSWPIRDVLARKCDPCHNAGRAGGNYRTDSYAALFGNGSDDNPNLVPGDARCVLVLRTSPGHSMFNVAHLSSSESQFFINWIVTYQARR